METINAQKIAELKDLWRQVLTRLQPTISKNHFVTWFNKSCILSIEGSVCKIGFPSAYSVAWVKDHYDVKILQAVSEINSEVKEVSYDVDGALNDKDDMRCVQVKELFADSEKKVRHLSASGEVAIGDLRSKFLNPKYSLDTFVVAKDNTLPYSACMAIASAPGGIYNPLFVYGGVGLGKTHLLHATGLEILKNYPDKVVVYVTSEQFVNDIVGAIRNQKMNHLKDKYRKADVLIVDDVQFFGKKEASQREFFHTINDLCENNKQVILSSDRPPTELDDLEDRLKSRFGMGMVVEILPPDFETRLAILQNRCAESGITVPNDALECIAHYIDKNVRDLVGAFNQFIGHVKFNNSVPTAELAMSIVQKFYAREMMIKNAYKPTAPNVYQGASATSTEIVTAERILAVISEFYRITAEELTGESRRKEILVPRQVCMYLMREFLNYSYERIGADFGGRNHTTVMHACEKIAGELKADYRMIRDLNSIKSSLGTCGAAGVRN
ncbi:MAG: chromosomal replication initiator protein DnaA [Candidatus Gracilibacteria bacterium]